MTAQLFSSMKSQQLIAANPLGFLFVDWIQPVFQSKTLNDSDLPEFQDCHKSKSIGSAFRIPQSVSSSSLIWAVARHRPVAIPLIASILATFLAVALQLVTPLFISEMVNYVSMEDGQKNSTYGWILAAIIFSLQFTAYLATSAAELLQTRVTQVLTSLFTDIVFHKMLKMNQTSKGKFSSAAILNIVNQDLTMIVGGFNQASNAIIAPIQIAVSIYLLYRLVSFALFGGVAALGLVILLNLYSGTWVAKFIGAWRASGTLRISLLKELLGISTLS
jgi:ABC-type multidrug transport system fused ATPase/permease subunit